MVNPVQISTANTQTVDGVSSPLTDPALAQELASLAYAAYDNCKTPQDVQAVTASIVSALAYAGLPTNGALMGFVNQCATDAKQQIAAGGTVSLTVANGPTLTDPDIGNEVATLASDAFAACNTNAQVGGVLRSVASALTAAGLPTTGPLVDYLTQLARGAAERIALQPQPQPVNTTGGDPLNNPTLATDYNANSDPASSYVDPGW
jgi:hypothetical protein